MRTLTRIWICSGVAFVLCLSATVAETDSRGLLLPQNITGARINLNPWGPQIGFETEIAGDHPGLEELAAVIREAEPGGGHKCSNAGAIRFRMEDGSVVGVGLLPGHTEGRYGLRLYDGDRYVATYSVPRARLLAVLEGIGVPMDDPAFR